MRIQLIIPKNKSLLGHKYTPPGHPHIGIAYLGAFLKKHGYEVKVYDDGLKNSLSLVDSVKEFRPDLVGVTSFSYCYDYAVDCIEKIKTNFDIPVVLGGPHVSVAKSAVLGDSKVDFAVKKEGEYSLLELAEALTRNKKDFSDINNLIWKKDGQIIENQDREFMNNLNLDELPFPDYSLFDVNEYFCAQHHSTALITSRGCPYSCTYCSTLLSMGKTFRSRSAENVFQEIKQRFNEGYRAFDINDDCFSLDIERANKICDLVIDSGLKIRFQCYSGLRVDRVNLELFKKMKKAGFYFLAFGCESGNPEVLKNIKKNITLDQVRNAVKWTKEAGIDSCVNFIIGHPTETYKQALDTLKFAKSLDSNYVNFSNLIPYPGTEAYEWILSNGRFLVDKNKYLRNLSTYDDMPIFETKEFTERQRKRITKLGHNYYYKRILIWRLGGALGSVVYYVTVIPGLRKLFSDFALNNKIGQIIYAFLSGQLR
ncbi:MAG: radical SAM protein [Candidatus Omnitrophica bacterium]|nr:radical SAM protein [Candidatus Omnitrophota bacterium]MDD5352458.1 radical SAM protein [Candidatus Omnitrophota bacterium]MDD5550056.1 radical SAM protein [Candidatus Omnitrophota bacterium]